MPIIIQGVYIAYNIWTTRNALIFEGIRHSPRFTLKSLTQAKKIIWSNTNGKPLAAQDI